MSLVYKRKPMPCSLRDMHGRQRNASHYRVQQMNLGLGGPHGLQMSVQNSSMHSVFIQDIGLI